MIICNQKEMKRKILIAIAQFFSMNKWFFSSL